MYMFEAKYILPKCPPESNATSPSVTKGNNIYFLERIIKQVKHRNKSMVNISSKKKKNIYIYTHTHT